MLREARQGRQSTGVASRRLCYPGEQEEDRDPDKLHERLDGIVQRRVQRECLATSEGARPSNPEHSEGKVGKSQGGEEIEIACVYGRKGLDRPGANSNVLSL